MAIFRYKAVTASGDPIEGEMEARTRDEVILKLQDAGNIPLDAREATSGGGAGLGGLFKRKAMAGPQLVVRPLAMDIPFNVSLLLPQVASPHPLRDALVEAITRSATGAIIG